ncbi:MAG: hypothetical protein AUK44_03360 [Porphyromonadaceae bacterium CG2_30_38_12]|nr:MAG: hypothetical protein AUK44_03360 [Porphyromonadaceae bacterium CG2_30_38_12]
MLKKLIFPFLIALNISFQGFALDSYIRINQLGYTPHSLKRAVLLSESDVSVTRFSVHDALTYEKLGEYNSIRTFGAFEKYKAVFILDFSAFTTTGAFYLKTEHCFSPTIFIANKVYQHTADFMLNFLRQQRCGYNPVLNNYCHQNDGIPFSLIKPVEIPNTKKISKQKSKIILPPPPVSSDFMGGWHDASSHIKYGATSAGAIFQLLYAYRMNSLAFQDNYDANGLAFANKIPDVLDEAKWGLEWLLKMYPDDDKLYIQVGDNREKDSLTLPANDMTDYGWGKGAERPVYNASGVPDGGAARNKNNGVASIAGKYAAAFALGSDLLRAYYPTFADVLEKKAYKLYAYGMQLPGVCQSISLSDKTTYDEHNWTDDMQLAATQLYQLSFDSKYLSDASNFGRMEPVSPWLFADTVSRYQWFPLTNYAHYVLANSEKPELKNEFLQNIKFGLKRAALRQQDNPFGVGVPMFWNSNSYVASLATQCNLYRRYAADSTFLSMETSLVDWLFGCNPWGVSMVVDLPHNANTPKNTYAALWQKAYIEPLGGLVSGPIKSKLSWADYADELHAKTTNEPSIYASSCMLYLLASKQLESNISQKNVSYLQGGIVRTDSLKKQICLVFSGHNFTDGQKKIRKTLDKNKIRASFFVSGDFLRNSKNKSYIKYLIKKQHYIGPHSDSHLAYCSADNKSQLLVDRRFFMTDLQDNYKALERWKINKTTANFFVPPFELYNDTISTWAQQAGIQLLCYTPKTHSYADNSFPEMREKYFSSNEIFDEIVKVEASESLNGHILLFHLGTDHRRTDKFYAHLESLVTMLKQKGYTFVRVNDAIEQ